MPAVKDRIPDTIPETSEELEELLADEPVAQAIFANAETRADFLVKYNRAANKARPDIQRMIDDGVQKGLRGFLIEAGVNRPDLTPDEVRKGAGANHGAAY